MHPRRAAPAYRLMFPLAAGFATASVPLWLSDRNVAGMTASVHAHEMIFGFALAVVAGFLVRQRGCVAWLLTVAWLLARVAAFLPPRAFSAAPGLIFSVSLLVFGAAPLWRAAKRPANHIAPIVLGLLVMADASWWYGRVQTIPQLQLNALLFAVDTLTLLLLIIGGRALQAAMGGYLQRQGIARRGRTGRGFELPLAFLLAAAAFADALGGNTVAGLLCIACAALTGIRIKFWRLHRSAAQIQLWTLALGYVWLIPGLLLKGLSQLGFLIPLSAALHGITVGALGTLTLVMMARTTALRLHHPVQPFTDIGFASILVSLAALLRLVAPIMPFASPVPLWAAAICWSSAFSLLVIRLLRESRYCLPRLSFTRANR